MGQQTLKIEHFFSKEKMSSLTLYCCDYIRINLDTGYDLLRIGYLNKPISSQILTSLIPTPNVDSITHVSLGVYIRTYFTMFPYISIRILHWLQRPVYPSKPIYTCDYGRYQKNYIRLMMSSITIIEDEQIGSITIDTSFNILHHKYVETWKSWYFDGMLAEKGYFIQDDKYVVLWKF